MQRLAARLHRQAVANLERNYGVDGLAVANPLFNQAIVLRELGEHRQSLAVAQRVSTEAELEEMAALPEAARRDRFLVLWTLKEAYIKARGDGLSFPLSRFEVSLTPGDPPALLRTWDDPPEAARWSLQALEPWPGYAAALAVESNDWLVSYWQMAHAI